MEHSSRDDSETAGVIYMLLSKVCDYGLNGGPAAKKDVTLLSWWNSMLPAIMRVPSWKAC